MAVVIFIFVTIIIGIDMLFNIDAFFKRKKVKKDIQYLETLRDWCASTGMNPDTYLQALETFKTEFKSIKEIKKNESN